VLRRSTRARAAAGPALAAALLAASAFACGAADTDYFGSNEPTWVRVPATLGDPVYVGVLLLRAQPGDSIELVSLAAGGVANGTETHALVSVLGEETTWIGAMTESDLENVIDLDTYRPLAGARFSAADGPVALVIRVTGSGPMQGFDGVVLSFRRNDGPVVEDHIPLRASICTGATFEDAVERCRPIESQMRSFEP
jgi:hypothetical protein